VTQALLEAAQRLPAHRQLAPEAAMGAREPVLSNYSSDVPAAAIRTSQQVLSYVLSTDSTSKSLRTARLLRRPVALRRNWPTETDGRVARRPDRRAIM
jgi:hypothetical protein